MKTRPQIEKDFWEEASKATDVMTRWVTGTEDKLTEQLMNIAPFIPKGATRIVELGCGVGRLTRPMASKFKEANFIAFDIAQGMIDLAKEDQPCNVRYLIGNGRTIPVTKNSSVDAIYSALTFQHIDTAGLLAYVLEAGRVLRKGGVLRFQYVNETEEGPFAFTHTDESVKDLLDFAGFDVNIQTGLIMSQWSWATGVKL